jgi:hypothetical protein
MGCVSQSVFICMKLSTAHTAEVAGVCGQTECMMGVPCEGCASPLASKCLLLCRRDCELTGSIMLPVHHYVLYIVMFSGAAVCVCRHILCAEGYCHVFGVLTERQLLAQVVMLLLWPHLCTVESSHHSRQFC